ncbi:hypothetical protein LUZ60_000218 [Juncus effusus]|nr:hypothetical protein LUZ60_000218 [Juncus effusus]
MALGNIVRGRREVGRGGGGFRGGRGGWQGGRGMVRGGPGVGGNFRGPGVGGNFRRPGAAMIPSRRPVGMLDTRPSSYKIAKSFKRLKDNNAWRNVLYENSSGAEEGKLFVSNLDFGVSNQDIKELFSEIGDLKRFGVHYDSHGHANGTAEVVFVRRSDAMAAMKRYNNVQLDGKPMKIELIGSNPNPARPITARVNVVASSDGRPKRTVVMMPQVRGRGGGPSRLASGFGRGRGGFQQARVNGIGRARGGGRGGRDGGRGGGRDGGRGGRGRDRGVWRRVDKSADQLDKELDTYHAKAMDTS